MKKLLSLLILAVCSMAGSPKQMYMAPIGSWPLCNAGLHFAFCYPDMPQTWILLVQPSSDQVTAFRWNVSGTLNGEHVQMTELTQRASVGFTWSRALDLTGWSDVKLDQVVELTDLP